MIDLHGTAPSTITAKGALLVPKNARNSSNSEDPSSCATVVATFCVFVSMNLIMGLYGTTNVWLRPNSSFLIKPTSFFVQNFIVEELGNKGSSIVLYRLNQAPWLDDLANWSEVHYLAVPNDSYKYLNKGSGLKVSYNVESVGSSLYLVIAQEEAVRRANALEKDDLQYSLRKVSRQKYLKKREQKKLEELRDEIEDEQYLFAGEKLTETELREYRRRDLLLLYSDTSELTKSALDLDSTEKMNPFAEQEAWEDHQIGKATLKFGAKNKQVSDDYQ